MSDASVTERASLRAARLDRLFSSERSLRMVPMDHGISMGPIPGLEDPAKAAAAVAPHATCFAVHKGLVRHTAGLGPGVLMHLSASTDTAPDPQDKRIVGTVAEALALGCDGVSVHINLGSKTEAQQLEDVGRVSTDCNLLGLPLVTMIYPRGPRIKNSNDPQLVAHAARLGAELGADAVKVPYTGDPDSFRPVTAGATVPVIVAGGPKRADFDAFLQDLRDARAAGAAGISIGRNVFGADDPGAVAREIARIFP